MAAYQAALDADPTAGDRSLKRGSMSALIVAYYQSAEWKALQPQTQRTYRLILDRFRAKYGDKPASQLQAKNIATILDQMGDTPEAANNLLKRLRSVFRFGVRRGLVPSNPTIGVERLKGRGTGFRTWTEDDIARFEARWAKGTRARLALYLLLYTGQRRSDVVRMGWQHLSKGPNPKLLVTQQKTGTSLEIPVHPLLQAELNLLGKSDLTFLMTAYGRPMSPVGLTNWFKECARKAGLPERSSPHGLRKAIARRLADAGATTHQIAAITGHRSLNEVERYSKGANQARLAEDAMATISGKRAR